MADLVFIDGKNLAYRAGWVHRQLSYKGKPTGLIYGFLNSLMKIMQKYPRSYIAVAWDGVPERRKMESLKGVADGIITSAYKQNREEKICPAAGGQYRSEHMPVNTVRPCRRDRKRKHAGHIFRYFHGLTRILRIKHDRVECSTQLNRGIR